MERDLNQITREVRTPSTTKNTYQRFLDYWAPVAYVAMQKMQFYTVDVPTWMGGYHQALKQNLSEADAAAYADNVLSTAQGSGLLSNQTPLERGRMGTARGREFTRLFTLLGSYMFSKFNLLSQSAITIKDPATFARFVSTVALAVVVEGSLAYLIRNMGFDEDDEEKSVAEVVARESLGTFAGTLPFVRDVFGYSRGGSYGDFNEAFNQATITLLDAGVAVVSEDVDFDFTLRDATTLAGVGGTVAALPAGTFNKVLRAALEDDFTSRDEALQRGVLAAIGLGGLNEEQ
jgi:hypothetical protein